MSLTDSQSINIEAFKIALDVCQQRNIEVSEEIKVIAHDPKTHVDQLNQLSESDYDFKVLMEEASQFLTTRQNVIRELLKALEKNQLNVCDLAFTLDQPVDRTQQIVQTLWQEGFIDVVTASPLVIIFPGLRSAAYRQRKVSTDTLLTLTSKGYFSLYPVFKSSESKA
jgi:hypothetical protein